jgi:hypothetical protein
MNLRVEIPWECFNVTCRVNISRLLGCIPQRNVGWVTQIAQNCLVVCSCAFLVLRSSLLFLVSLIRFVIEEGRDFIVPG